MFGHSVTRNTGGRRRLIIGGPIMLGVFLVLLLALVIVEVVAYINYKTVESVRSPAAKYVELTKALSDEFKEKLLTGQAATRRKDATDSAVQEFDSKLKNVNTNLVNYVAQMRVASQPRDVLLHYINALRNGAASCFSNAAPKLRPRLKALLRFSTATFLSFNDLALSDAIQAMHKLGYPEVELIHFAADCQSSIEAYETLFTEIVGEQFSHNFSTVAEKAMLSRLVARSVVDYAQTKEFHPIEIQTAANASVKRSREILDAVEVGNLSTTSLLHMLLYAVVAVLTAVGIGLSVYVIIRSMRLQRRGQQLVDAFGNADVSRAMVGAYRNVLHNMRTDNIPNDPLNEVSKYFDEAAQLVVELRPMVPQALFGELHGAHPKQPNGEWSIEAQPVRLEMSYAFSQVTAMTISFQDLLTDDRMAANQETAVKLVADMAGLLSVISEEVNSSGGIVAYVSPNGRVTCVWGATNAVEDPGLAALRVAQSIDRKLVNYSIDISITTGGCYTANSKVGGRKHVTLIGALFEMAEKLLLLNEIHNARLILDYDTFRTLPRERQRLCKPIAVVNDRNDSAVVVLTADESWRITGTQWKMYNTAFTLYQNNMLAESLGEFKKYLAQYPRDQGAQWLVERVLEPKLKKRGRHTDTK